MRAGKLRHHVTLQRRTVANNAMGEPIETWRDVNQVWAQVSPVSGSEQVVADMPEARITHEVTMRYTTQLEAKMRLKYGDRIMAIAAPFSPDELRKEIKVACTEIL